MVDPLWIWTCDPRNSVGRTLNNVVTQYLNIITIWSVGNYQNTKWKQDPFGTNYLFRRSSDSTILKLLHLKQNTIQTLLSISLLPCFAITLDSSSKEIMFFIVCSHCDYIVLELWLVIKFHYQVLLFTLLFINEARDYSSKRKKLVKLWEWSNGPHRQTITLIYLKTKKWDLSILHNIQHKPIFI